jgi:hypothetical protein
MTQFLKSITPLSALQRQSLQRPHKSAPLAVCRAISLPFSHPLSSVIPRISLIYAVQDVTSFVGLMVLFPRISFEISLCVPSLVVLVLFRESTHFSIFFCWTQGWGVLVCPWSFSRASRSKSKAHFYHHHCCYVSHHPTVLEWV